MKLIMQRVHMNKCNCREKKQITLDRDLRTSSRFDDFMRKECVSPKAVLHENRVLEIKYDEFLPDFIAGILEYGNMIQTSFSKYRICREQKG